VAAAGRIFGEARDAGKVGEEGVGMVARKKTSARVSAVQNIGRPVARPRKRSKAQDLEKEIKNFWGGTDDWGGPGFDLEKGLKTGLVAARRRLHCGAWNVKLR